MAWANNYLVGRQEMITNGINTGIFNYKSGGNISTDGLKILTNATARANIWLYEPALPSNTLEVPIYQEYIPLYHCGGGTTKTFTAGNNIECISITRAVDMGTSSGNVSWATSNFLSGTPNSLRLRIFYPYTNTTALYDQTFTTGSPPPANITWTYTYSGGSGQIIRILVTCT
jgi:hypothetical protein